MRRVAIVTGASAGIGRATARRLARGGYAVVVTARRVDRLTELERELAAEGLEVMVIPGNIAELTTCERLVRRAADWGHLEVLVANAGFGYNGPIEGMADEVVRQMVDVNILGVVRTVRAAIPRMRAHRESGMARIVIVGSVLSRVATAGNAVYCATKHALAGFADSLRQDLARENIKVITILPGYTDTEFFEAMPRREAKASAVAAMRRFKFCHTAEDVADLIVYRIQHPAAESVVGRINGVAVFVATRFPGFFYSVYGAVDRVMRGDFRRIIRFMRRGETREVRCEGDTTVLSQ